MFTVSRMIVVITIVYYRDFVVTAKADEKENTANMLVNFCLFQLVKTKRHAGRMTTEHGQCSCVK